MERPIWVWSGEQRDHTSNESRHHYFGTYWPFIRKGAQTSDAAGSLWSQLQTAYLTPNGLPDTPREYVENQFNTPNGAKVRQGEKYVCTNRGSKWKNDTE